MTIISNPKERTRFIRFAIVGIIGGVVDFGVFNLLATLLGVPAIIASMISFSLAVVNNFIWNRLWTFPETKQTSLIRQLIQFSVVSVVGLGIRTPLFAWMERLLIPVAERFIPNLLTPTIIGHNLSLGIAIFVVMLWNFFANRYWTFRNVAVEKEIPYES